MVFHALPMRFASNSMQAPIVVRLWTTQSCGLSKLGKKQLGPLIHNSPPKLATVRIHVLVPELRELNIENFRSAESCSPRISGNVTQFIKLETWESFRRCL